MTLMLAPPRHMASVLGGLIAVHVACEPASERAVWEGEHVTVHSTAGIRLCGGTLEFFDRFVAKSYEYWAQATPPADFHMRLELREPSRGVVAGRALIAQRSAWAKGQSATTHELAHLVTQWDAGIAAPVFSEGAAEAFGSGFGLHQWVDWLAATSADAFVFANRSDFSSLGDVYYPSGQFVGFLVRRYGIEAVRTAVTMPRYGGSRADNEAELAAVFTEVFDEDLHEVLRAFEEAAPCPLQAWECSGDVLPAHTLPVHIEAEHGCEDSETYGAVAEDNLNWYPLRMFTLELDDDVHAIDISVAQGATVLLEPCITACSELPHDPAHAIAPAFGRSRETFTPAARRYVVSVALKDPSRDFDVHFTRSSSRP